jgi:TMEM199 family protein
MVLLTMTAAVVAAVEVYLENNQIDSNSEEPNLNTPKVGNPICHGQLVDISRYFKSNHEKLEGKNADGTGVPIHLSELLKGCSIYSPPPKPKPEPVCFSNLLVKHLAKDSITVLGI